VVGVILVDGDMIACDEVARVRTRQARPDPAGAGAKPASSVSATSSGAGPTLTRSSREPRQPPRGHSRARADVRRSSCVCGSSTRSRSKLRSALCFRSALKAGDQLRPGRDDDGNDRDRGRRIESVAADCVGECLAADLRKWTDSTCPDDSAERVPEQNRGHDIPARADACSGGTVSPVSGAVSDQRPEKSSGVVKFWSNAVGRRWRRTAKDLGRTSA